ncbi:MAG: hypothetical protein FWD68_02105 [Alphaproteobacteria bacterium]|nr:hypothetical protein [Alphaproteobacteria bacterium]
MLRLVKELLLGRREIIAIIVPPAADRAAAAMALVIFLVSIPREFLGGGILCLAGSLFFQLSPEIPRALIVGICWG